MTNQQANKYQVATYPFPGSRCEVYLDGIPLKGEWRGGTRRPNRRGEEVKAGRAASQCNHMHGESCSRLLNLRFEMSKFTLLK